MQTKYLGPADVFIVGNKSIRKGEMVNLSKESILHHTDHGHLFEVDGLAPSKPAPWDTPETVSADDQKTTDAEEMDPRLYSDGGLGSSAAQRAGTRPAAETSPKSPAKSSETPAAT